MNDWQTSFHPLELVREALNLARSFIAFFEECSQRKAVSVGPKPLRNVGHRRFCVQLQNSHKRRNCVDTPGARYILT